jgi:glycolate oxidase iron-sulfur subunit
MLGCVERGLYPSVSRAATQLCPELTVPASQGCCGALHAHNGDKHAGEAMARELGKRLPGTIVTTAGGCAGHLAAVLGHDRVMELSQYLVRAGHQINGEVRVDGRRARVTLQDSCHLRVELGGTAAPRELLAQIADLVELPGAGTCCGAAGSYSLLQRARSRKILKAKVEAIERLGVDYVVTVNPGCQRQLATGLSRAKSKAKVVPIAELLVHERSSECCGQHKTCDKKPAT